MGGDITVASELGRGSLFTAVVPLGVVDAEDATAAELLKAA